MSKELVYVETVTLYKGKDSVTFLAKDFEMKGVEASPFKISIYPTENRPYVKFNLSETDGFSRQKDLIVKHDN